MNDSDTEQKIDSAVLEWADEMDAIMKVAVQKAIEENARLRLDAGDEEKPASPRVSED